MKMKLDFVTNSSSTSFIITSKIKLKKQEIPVKIDLTINLAELIDVEITTIEKLNEEFGWWKEENESYKEKYRKCEETINNGGVVYVFSAADDGDAAEAYLCQNGLGENAQIPDFMEVIEGEGGY